MSESSKPSSSWYNEERTILYSILEGDGAWETFHARRREAYAMIASQPHTVHAIMDIKNNRLMPQGIAANMQQSFDELPPNIGLVIIIGTNMLTQSLFTVVKRVFLRHPVTERLFLVRSLEHGLELIENYRPDTSE